MGQWLQKQSFLWLMLELQEHDYILTGKSTCLFCAGTAGFKCSLHAFGFHFPIPHVSKEGEEMYFILLSTYKTG